MSTSLQERGVGRGGGGKLGWLSHHLLSGAPRVVSETSAAA